MKKTFLFILFGFSLVSIAQTHDAWIYFTDKPQASYYLDNPQEILSQRALERRLHQNISIELSDVPIHQPYITEIINTASVSVWAQSKWLNAIHIRGTLEAISSLAQLSFVENIEFADKSLNTSSKTILNNPKPTYNNKILNTQNNFSYGESFNQIELHNGHLLHEQGYTGNGKIIAVLDNGFIGVNTATPFDRLHNENLILGGYNFVTRNQNFYSGGDHGTRVLSTIGAYQENQLIGTAPNAQFYLFITEDINSESPLEESLWVEAAEVADSLGVDIINTSLGYNTFDNSNYNYSYQDMDGNTAFITRGLNFAYAKGILCVTSAGNEGNQNWQYITAPADAQGSLTIGATNHTGEYASFSSIGPTADNRIKPDVVAQGVYATTATPLGQIVGTSGTSFSAPIIAGLAACLWEAFPDLTNQELMQLIKESAHLYNNPSNQLGYGIPDFYQAYQTLNNSPTSESLFLLYPNPTTDFMFLETDYIGSILFQLFDVTGKKIREKIVENKAHINLQQLQRGMYFYHISYDNQYKTGRIIKK